MLHNPQDSWRTSGASCEAQSGGLCRSMTQAECSSAYSLAGTSAYSYRPRGCSWYRSGSRSPGFVTRSSESCGAGLASFTPSLARVRRQIYATCQLWLPSSANRRCERSNVFWETPRNNLAQTSVRAGARIPKIALEATRSRGRRGEQSRGRCETLRSALRCRLERFPQRLFGTSTNAFRTTTARYGGPVTFWARTENKQRRRE